MSEETKLVTLRELAKAEGVDHSSLRKWIVANDLHHVSIKVPCGKGGSALAFTEEYCQVIREKRATKETYETSINIGHRFGRLEIIGPPVAKPVKNRTPKSCRQRLEFPCRCDCGKELLVFVYNLSQGETKSCGCLSRETTALINRTHGQTVKRHKPPLYSIWTGMRERCNNPNNSHYDYYGGKGVFVCEEWSNFLPFQEWALGHGYSSGLSIDRIDVDGPYHPENCRFATALQQANNKTTTIYFEACGEEKSIGDWARDARCAVSHSTLYQRITKWFWEPERSITEPINRRW